MNNFLFGFLSTYEHPLLIHYISSALNSGCKNIVVICDEKVMSESDRIRWQERTGGEMDDSKVTIYDYEEKKIPFYFVKDHNSDNTISLINSLGIDCLLNAGTPRKLKSGVINSCEYGIVNVHPGLLPKYRGCTCVEWALYNDDKVGNTAHFMDEEYDSGPIITSEWYEFPKEADYQSIRLKVYKEGCKLAGRVLADFQNSKFHPSDATQQDEKKGQYHKPIPKDKMDVVNEKLRKQIYPYQTL